MPREERPFNWQLWLQWILATTLGWLLGGAILPLELGAGAAIGFLQWLVLRPLIGQAGWWIGASTVGWLLGWGLLTILPPQIVFGGAILGVTTGIAQWFVLRKWTLHASWWPLISALAWIIGLSNFIAGETLVGAVVGAITGIALELLMRFSS